MRSCGVLSDGFKIPKCTSHLGFGLVDIGLLSYESRDQQFPLWRRWILRSAVASRSAGPVAEAQEALLSNDRRVPLWRRRILRSAAASRSAGPVAEAQEALLSNDRRVPLWRRRILRSAAASRSAGPVAEARGLLLSKVRGRLLSRLPFITLWRKRFVEPDPNDFLRWSPSCCRTVFRTVCRKARCRADETSMKGVGEEIQGMSGGCRCPEICNGIK